MALPKLETKTYTLTLPSTGEDIKYRPFLVKEQKTLLMAQEAKTSSETVDAMSQLINDCTFGKVNPKTCPIFDAEYIFLKLRAKSVGEKARVQVTCEDDGETTVYVDVNLDEVECNMIDNHSNTVEITENIKMIFNYPLLKDFNHISGDKATAVFSLIRDSVKEIHFEDKVYNKIDMSKKELDEFIDSLNTQQFKKITNFFDSMPRLRHVINVVNPKTKIENEIVIEGLQSFLV